MLLCFECIVFQWRLESIRVPKLNTFRTRTELQNKLNSDDCPYPLRLLIKATVTGAFYKCMRRIHESWVFQAVRVQVN